MSLQFILNFYSNGQNSEIMQAELSIQQGNMVLYNKEFDEGSLVDYYTVDLVDIVNTFNEIDSNVDNQLIYFHRCFRRLSSL